MKSSYYFDKQSVKPNTSKLQKRILDIMVPMEPMTAAPSTSDLISIGDQNHDNLVDIGTPNIIESITMSGGNGNNPLHPKASGWMELIDDNGEALTDSTEVGTPVSLVIRIKQMASMDTMLSTCTAHSGKDYYIVGRNTRYCKCPLVEGNPNNHIMMQKYKY